MIYEVLGFENGHPIVIFVSEVESFLVNILILDQVKRMIVAAKKDGIKLSGVCFRTMVEQEQIWNLHPNPKYVAMPGYSRHQMALAIDFDGCSPLGKTPVSTWLEQHAREFGAKRYLVEDWHYDFESVIRII